jgi:pimeloyl-ACP methyl ester carboxylesterase
MKSSSKAKPGRRKLLTGSLKLGIGLAAGASAARAARAAVPRNWIKPPLLRGYAAGPYGLIHYRDVGAGRPLILFHQAPMSSQQFTAAYPLFKEKGIRAIGVDMPGFGGSDVTPFVPKIEDWAKIYPALLDHLKIRRADVLGHHTGATVATEVTLQFPQRVRKLVIHGALMVTEPERAARLARVQESERKGHDYKLDGSHLSNRFAGVVRRYGDGADPKVITRFVTEEFSHTGPGWYGHNAAYVYDHGASLKRVRVPALLVNNTGDIVYELTNRLRSVRPDFAYAELQGGGVDIVDQQPQAWVDAIAKFLLA